MALTTSLAFLSLEGLRLDGSATTTLRSSSASGTSQCVVCTTNPSCNCASDETCQYTLQSCTECARAVCVANSSGTNKGAIAGGVVGGFVFLAAIVGLALWWFVLRHRKRSPGQPIDEEAEGDESEDDEDDAFDENPGPMPRSNLNSASYARHNSRRESKAGSFTSVNTTQDRGSNVIPIAYIPGVSVFPRGADDSNSSHLPIRNSISASNYRASVPEISMAIQGQPSLVDIHGNPRVSAVSNPESRESSATMGTLNREGSISSQNIPEVPSTASAVSLSAYGRPSQLASLYPPVAQADTVDAGTNAGNSMVSVNPQSSNTSHPHPEQQPQIAAPSPRTSSIGVSSVATSQRREPTRRSSLVSRSRRNSAQESRFSRASSNREYLKDLPEEAYLYHGGGMDEESEKGEWMSQNFL